MQNENFLFHIEHNDYFGTTESVLDLLHQDILKEGFKREHYKTFNDIVKQLLYLQRHYVILKKDINV